MIEFAKVVGKICKNGDMIIKSPSGKYKIKNTNNEYYISKDGMNDSTKVSTIVDVYKYINNTKGVK